MKKINLWIVSLGCNKTFVDTQNLVGSLKNMINIVDEWSADVILLNTCSFLAAARDEVIENLNSFKDKKVILVWCYTKFVPKDLFTTFPQVWAVIPTNKYLEISNVLESIINNKRVFFDFEIEDEYLEMPESKVLTLAHVAYVKISEWCDNTCTYCTIPKIRWAFRSRKKENVLKEVKSLVTWWCKEIILTSQDTWYYGREIKSKEKYDFSSLLSDILTIKWDFRIRFLYIYPERINSKLLKLISENEKIIPYFDIPFQHASKDILMKMKRPHWDKLLWSLVDQIRKLIPGSVIRTTFIVWFPWETEKDFKQLVDFIKKYKFERIWIFTYSNEKWAESYNFPKQVSEKVKNSRYEKLYKLSAKISLENNKSLVDNQTLLKVSIEWHDAQEGFLISRSYRECLEVDPVIYVTGKQDHEIWDEINVKIIWCDEFDLYWEEV